jgi:hypothetical protein
MGIREKKHSWSVRWIELLRIVSNNGVYWLLLQNFPYIAAIF